MYLNFLVAFVISRHLTCVRNVVGVLQMLDDDYDDELTLHYQSYCHHC